MADFSAHSDRLTMSNETKIWTLHAGLSPGLTEVIHYRDEPTDLTVLIDHLNKAEIKTKACQAENSHRH